MDKNTDEKQEISKNKIEYMRSLLSNEEKSKEIAKKLTDYILSNKQN